MATRSGPAHGPESERDWASLVAGRSVDATPASTFQELVDSRASYDFRHLNVDLPPLGAFHHDVVLGEIDERPVTAEIYIPQGHGPFPTMLFLHGGGWYVGDAENERKLAMQLAAPGRVVVNLSYALAPEQPFPCAVQDTVHAARWITRNIHRYTGDPTRIAIAGASAGANLAAAAIAALHGTAHPTMAAGDLAGIPVRFTAGALLYGVFDVARTVSDAQGLAQHQTKTAAYLGPQWPDRLNDPLVSPIHSPHLADFPPCYLSCGSKDALLPQTLAMTQALADAEVPVTLSVVPGADHVFLNIATQVPGAQEELTRISDWLHRTLATT
ncbi:alpha/beta hydrolase [Actinomadura violacea]|uniref:Alpha/beta hydrolase n=1 Tax=Actinomadura violacea TaxID=2819934 RepID=A0ABS3RQ38_9ACTN|nr:alpha/beta hydrolase [Actinomadura violacea]MBO2458185.1 alpha/beta hydrolase [Actinomadura violacea]